MERIKKIKEAEKEIKREMETEIETETEIENERAVEKAKIKRRAKRKMIMPSPPSLHPTSINKSPALSHRRHLIH